MIGKVEANKIILKANKLWRYMDRYSVLTMKYTIIHNNVKQMNAGNILCTYVLKVNWQIDRQYT